jgi:hypothetical protein
LNETGKNATMSFRGVITFFAFILLTKSSPYLASTVRLNADAIKRSVRIGMPFVSLIG